MVMVNTLTGREAEEFGRRLRHAREHAPSGKMSLDELAEQAGCSKQMLSKWENGGVTRPDYITLVKVCAALGIEPGALLKLKD